MDDARSAIFEWALRGRLPEAKVPEALRLGEVTPDRGAWWNFIDRLLLGLGVVFVAVGGTFFVAANWQAMGLFVKFGLIEVPIVACIAMCWWRGLDTRVARATLFAAALFTGALLALVGQVYQTGADTFELFVAWAIAIVAWAAVARMPALWLLWLGIVNAAITFYFAVFPNLFGFLFFEHWNVLWALFAFDALALVVWEIACARGIEWLRARWAIRAVVFAGGTAITAAALLHAIDLDRTHLWTLLVYGVWLAAMYWAYRRRTTDLFVLAGCVLSVALVAAALALRLLLSADAGGLLLTGILVSGIAAWGARWLRRVAAEERVT